MFTLADPYSPEPPELPACPIPFPLCPTAVVLERDEEVEAL